MGRRAEPLTGGVVTDVDPAFLKPGQLSDIRNMVYRNGSSALERATGRAVFGAASAAATGVWGLRDMHFDNGDHYLVAGVGAKYRFATVGDTGTFSDLVDITAGTSLEVTQYRNRFFLMNGATADTDSIGSNQVIYLSATAVGTTPSSRQHGMLPVVAAPSVTTAGGGFFAQDVTGYYEYWTTEVAKTTQDGADLTLESAFSSDSGVTTTLISATSVVPTIQPPVFRNGISTHWRIYRSAKKDVLTDKLYPAGFMIAEVGSGVSAHADTIATASASSLATAFNSGANYGDWASASSMSTDNGVYASATVAALGSPPVRDIQRQGVYGFTLSGVAGNIRGIAVEIQGYISSGAAPGQIQATLGQRKSDGSFVGGKTGIGGGPSPPRTASKSGYILSSSSASPTTLTLGGPTDRWFPTDGSVALVDTEFDGNLMLVLSFGTPGKSIGVDYVKVYVYYGASSETTIQFPTVVYTFGDITSQVAKNFPPPSSSTGDLFQDSLVVNDVSNPSLVRYSFPGEPEYFPGTYYMDFETRENDEVQAIRVVSNRLMIGLDTSLWRVNYLPSERDATFDRGKAVETVSSDFGIIGPMLCCTFTIDGEAEQMAFISHKGLHTTDGFNAITRSKNQDWRNYISLTSTSTPISLLNDPENRCLRFIYRNDSLGNETYMQLFASYDRADIDAAGNFKFSGPVHMRNYDSAAGGTYASVESAWAVSRSNGNTGIYIGYGGTNTAPGAGKVYFETGTTIPSNDSTCQYTTRRIYAAGMSAEWMLDDLYGYCGSYTGSPILTYTFKGTKTNDTGETSRGSKTITLAGQKLHHLSPKVQVEGLRITMQATASAVACEQLILGSTVYGTEDSGR